MFFKSLFHLPEMIDHRLELDGFVRRVPRFVKLHDSLDEMSHIDTREVGFRLPVSGQCGEGGRVEQARRFDRVNHTIFNQLQHMLNE